ncbi:MAG: hypothetical protein LBK61_14175 [Spirochaetaceae bacterium]|nr:hypothetical protein [Spirochaetaceae bacterium]
MKLLWFFLLKPRKAQFPSEPEMRSNLKNLRKVKALASRRPLDKRKILAHNGDMVVFLKAKWARFVTVAYMATAIMGTFAFALADSFPSINLGKDKLSPGGIFAPIDYAVNCLAEGNSTTGKAGRNSFSPMRNNFSRIDMLPGLQKTETLFSYELLRTIEETNRFDKKNTILLKLRI